MTTFYVAKPELKRRMLAFTTLCISWIAAQIILVRLFMPSQLLLGAVFTGGLMVALAALWGATRHFFYAKYNKMQIRLQDQALVRATTGGDYVIEYDHIARIITKMTTRGFVRQISIKTKDGQWTNIDGLQNFAELNTALGASCPDAEYSTLRESLDYDSVLFYPILGILLGALSTAMLSAAANQATARIFLLPIAIYLVFVAGIFAAVKPFARQYGKRAASLDYVLCVLLAVLAVVTSVLFVLR